MVSQLISPLNPFCVSCHTIWKPSIFTWIGLSWLIIVPFLFCQSLETDASVISITVEAIIHVLQNAQVIHNFKHSVFILVGLGAVCSWRSHSLKSVVVPTCYIFGGIQLHLLNVRHSYSTALSNRLLQRASGGNDALLCFTILSFIILLSVVCCRPLWRKWCRSHLARAY